MMLALLLDASLVLLIPAVAAWTVVVRDPFAAVVAEGKRRSCPPSPSCPWHRWNCQTGAHQCGTKGKEQETQGRVGSISPVIALVVSLFVHAMGQVANPSPPGSACNPHGRPATPVAGDIAGMGS